MKLFGKKKPTSPSNTPTSRGRSSDSSPTSPRPGVNDAKTILSSFRRRSPSFGRGRVTSDSNPGDVTTTRRASLERIRLAKKSTDEGTHKAGSNPADGLGSPWAGKKLWKGVGFKRGKDDTATAPPPSPPLGVSPTPSLKSLSKPPSLEEPLSTCKLRELDKDVDPSEAAGRRSSTSIVIVKVTDGDEDVEGSTALGEGEGASPARSAGTPTQGVLLGAEAATRARLRRAESNVQDAEYTCPSTPASGGTEDLKALTPANLKTPAKRMGTSIACPGFGNAGAEDELRKALQLRKLKTQKVNVET